jgi:hypothetical protein
VEVAAGGGGVALGKAIAAKESELESKRTLLSQLDAAGDGGSRLSEVEEGSDR